MSLVRNHPAAVIRRRNSNSLEDWNHCILPADSKVKQL